MFELGDGLGLSLEAGEAVRVLRHRLGLHLDRLVAVESLVGSAVPLPIPPSPILSSTR